MQNLVTPTENENSLNYTKKRYWRRTLDVSEGIGGDLHHVILPFFSQQQKFLSNKSLLAVLGIKKSLSFVYSNDPNLLHQELGVCHQNCC
jgi:hypothetical protein